MSHPERGDPLTLRLHVALEDADPPVWRRINVASDLGLDDLHNVLQALFGWEGYHLYRFTTGPEQDPGAAFTCAADLREGWDDDPSAPTWDVRVDELLSEVGERLYYQYDYGDNWWLAIEVEDVVESLVPAGRVALLDGAGVEPPEDCGGVHGYGTLVAAADATHPDHHQALDEVQGMWGREVTPDAIDLVPFDRGTVTDRLRAIDLSNRPPVPRHVGDRLRELLLRVRDNDTERHLRSLASSADAPADVDETTAYRMLRPLRVILDLVGDGLKLTAAGYLPPPVVRMMFDELELGDEWIGAGNREDLTLPVLELREAAQRLGLLRKHKGRLLPTARVRKLANDPVGLWWHVAGRLPIGGRDATDASWQAGVLLLAFVASGSTDDADTRIAQLLTGLGWALDGGQLIDRRTVTGLVAQDVRLLRRLGALNSHRRGDWPGRPTGEGSAFARAALR